MGYLFQKEVRSSLVIVGGVERWFENLLEFQHNSLSILSSCLCKNVRCFVTWTSREYIVLETYWPIAIECASSPGWHIQFVNSNIAIGQFGSKTIFTWRWSEHFRYTQNNNMNNELFWNSNGFHRVRTQQKILECTRIWKRKFKALRWLDTLFKQKLNNVKFFSLDREPDNL